MRGIPTDLYGTFTLAKSILGILAILVPAYLLMTNSFRQLGRAPKDSYEAAYLVIAWLGLAWVLGR